MIAIYARQSVERENSISIQTQIEYCKCSIKPDERNIKVNIYKDEGASGGNVDRKDFQKLLKDIKKGKITKVIVYKLDRMSRSLSDFVGILQTFKDNNVKFVSSQEAFDTSSPYGELIIKILMVFAEFERQSIIRRVTDAYHARSDMGIYMGGQIPYGFKLEPISIGTIKTKMYVPILEETEHICYIYEMYAQENMSLNRLVKDLVTNNISPKKGEAWSGSKLSAILKNPIYVKADADIYTYFSKHGANIVNDITEFTGEHGVKLYGKKKYNFLSNDWADTKLVLMKHEGIVDSNLWLKCQRKLEKNRQIKRAVSNTTTWLGGKMYCANCGHGIRVQKNSAQVCYLNCTGKQNKKICSGFNQTMYAKEFEDMVSEAIAKKLDTLKDSEYIIKSNSHPQLNTLKIELKNLELEEKKLLDIMMNEHLNSDLLTVINTKASDLKREKIFLYEHIEMLKEQAVNIKQTINLAKKWDKASFEEKKAVANILINKIVFKQDGTSEIVWNI